ncbi:MAG: YvcK family protein [Candidatus Omnitrophica bacterium]|nr:YvcK family protein [Candidatus Omnitrophota bacterium]
MLTALTDIRGSMAEAVRALGDIMNVQGLVIPVTEDNTRLCAEFEDGSVVEGESRIDRCENRPPDLKIRRIWLSPAARASAEATASILSSDYVLIGPGDLYTSIIANLAVEGVSEAISQSHAKKIYISNLMTKPGETGGMDAYDHVREIVRYLGRDVLDAVVVSDTQVSQEGMETYSNKRQSPVSIDRLLKEGSKITRARIVSADIGHETELVRHHSQKLKTAIKTTMDRLS